MLEIEDEVNEDIIKALKIISESSYSNDAFVITENVHGHITIKSKNKNIVLFYRDREGGGHNGNVSKHFNSIKIKHPASLENITIEIPTEGKPEPIVKGSPTDSQMQDIKPVVDFVANNARYLNSIYKSKNEFTKRRAATQIVNRNKDIIADIDYNDSNTSRDDFKEKLKGKLNK